MRITFDLPPPAATLLLRLAAHIRDHAGTEPSCDAICRSLVTDILVDDAVCHGVIAEPSRVVQ
jgi:hypothetical protein